MYRLFAKHIRMPGPHGSEAKKEKWREKEIGRVRQGRGADWRFNLAKYVSTENIENSWADIFIQTSYSWVIDTNTMEKVVNSCVPKYFMCMSSYSITCIWALLFCIMWVYTWMMMATRHGTLACVRRSMTKGFHTNQQFTFSTPSSYVLRSRHIATGFGSKKMAQHKVPERNSAIWSAGIALLRNNWIFAQPKW